MGDFRIVVNAAGGHGCDRTAKDGETVTPCNRMDCPDCEARRFIREFRGHSEVVSAELIHWPKDSPSGGCPEVRDDLLTGKRTGSF